MQKIMVIANWKCNPATLKEAKRLFEVAEENVKNIRNIKGVKNDGNVEVVICAPFVWIGILMFGVTPVRALSASRNNILTAVTPENIKLGAQDCFWEQKGPYTGEVSAPMLKDIGCEYVILGHSERRQYFSETEEMINKKIKAALSSRMKPILCVGEKKDEKENIKNILEKQLMGALSGVEQPQIRNIIIAYEPVWAISTSGGEYCAPDYAFSANLIIKKFLFENYGNQRANDVKIIYGGSVDSSDAATYIKEAKMEGVLVGAASLKAEEFRKIIRSVTEIKA